MIVNFNYILYNEISHRVGHCFWLIDYEIRTLVLITRRVFGASNKCCHHMRVSRISRGTAALFHQAFIHP